MDILMNSVRGIPCEIWFQTLFQNSNRKVNTKKYAFGLLKMDNKSLIFYFTLGPVASYRQLLCNDVSANVGHVRLDPYAS
jgi:hypothetical protein